MTYGRIAEAVVHRYGNGLLEWLNYPAFTNGEVSFWIRGDLRPCRTGTRSAAVGFQLLAGTICDSLISFEKVSSQCRPFAVRIPVHQSEPKSTGSWVESLGRKLKANSYRIAATALECGVHPYTAAAEARRQRIRVPLPVRLRQLLSDTTVRAVKRDLRKGVPKRAIQELHSISEWTLLLIELEEPGIGDEHRAAASIRIRDMHRVVVEAIIGANRGASRQTVMIMAPGTYDYMLKNDCQWFQSHCPAKIMSLRHSGVRAHCDRSHEDVDLAASIRSKASNLLCQPGRPARITERTLLKQFGSYSRYLRNRESYPHTTDVLNNVCESREQFTRRKIEWALQLCEKKGNVVSMNLLRRLASMTADRLCAYRAFVAEAATRTGVVIDSRSVLAGAANAAAH